MKRKVKSLLAKTKPQSETQKLQKAADQAPRITNTSIAEHREAVLSGARKYKIPLAHSKHQIVIITSTLFVAALVAFFTYIVLALYKFEQSSTFLYRVTQVLPLPAAKAGSQFVSYESYLFELRHFVHYYEHQQKTDFTDPNNNEQLEEFKRRSLGKVINDAYVSQLARERGVSVSEQEVNDAITMLRSQNRLGSSDKVFEDVLKDYWGWSVNDFKRSLRAELLAQKVVASLDTGAQEQANKAYARIKAGEDFAAVAREISTDEDTKAAGGDIPRPIDRTDRNLSAKVTDALFRLEPGQYSEVINTGNSLVIVKNIERLGERIHAAQIVVDFKDIETFVDDKKEAVPARQYIRN